MSTQRFSPVHLVSPTLVWLICSIFGGLLYASTLYGTYVYDDLHVARTDVRLGGVLGRPVENGDTDSALKTPTARARPVDWPSLWTRAYWVDSQNRNDSIDNLYRPLTTTSYAVQAWLHGHSPRWLHLVNVLLYAVGCGLVASLARVWTASPFASLCAGLLFAAHPLHVEAVAMIVGRAELLSWIGIATALLGASAPTIRPRDAALIVGGSVIALLSKEQGMLTPALVGWVLAARWWCRKKGDMQAAGGNPLKAAVGLLCLLVGSYVVIRESRWGLDLKFWWDRSQLDWVVNPMVLATGSDRWLMPVALLGRYAALMLYPVNLSPDYSGLAIGTSTSPHDGYLWLGCAALIVGLSGFAIALRRRDYVLLCCVGLAALTYLTISNSLTLIGTLFGERLIFLPTAFLCIALAQLVTRCLPTFTAAFAVFIALTGHSFRTVTYAIQWNDRTPFYESALQNQPNSARLRELLIDSYLQSGRLADAATVAMAGRQRLAAYDEMWLLSGHIAGLRNNWPAAVAFYEHALAMKFSPRTLAGLRAAQGHLPTTQLAK